MNFMKILARGTRDVAICAIWGNESADTNQARISKQRSPSTALIFPMRKDQSATVPRQHDDSAALFLRD